ncbi:MAG: hypothetical protein ACK4NW_02645 [Roseinatronobacter sp.]
MNKYIFLTQMITGTIIASAAYSEIDPDHICAKYGEVAEVTMMGRQEGLTFDTLLGLAGGSPAIRTIIEDAFEVPQLETESSQQAAIDDFRGMVTLRCLEDRAD